MKKRFITGILTAALTLGALTGCGGSDDAGAAADNAAQEAPAADDAAQETADAEDTAPAAEDAAQDDAAGADGAAEMKGTITVAASATPHAEILEQAKPILAEQGWDLQIEVFSDYVQPNMVVESGDFDANYFQHIPYLDSFNEEQGTHLVNAGGIHYEPFGIYPGTKSDLTTLEKGDVIAVPNDTTNEARALLLLQDNGIITLKDGVGLEATVRDITDNPNEIEIQELEAAQVPRVKDEVAFVVLNGNYAMEAGFSVSKDSIAYESSDSEAAKTYVNVIAVKEGNENNEAVKALVEVLKSDEITNYINDTYDGGVIPFK
ncbi:MAG: MetQ/NlpA family ABC transporter substrate-binding protein [Eubacterium sp.]|nr:MetQ/NlpA family ABC transporter substrate-binding protein [Eubacterium sp.]